MSAREGIAIEVDAPAPRLPLEHDTEEHLYRFVQEALNNVVKHAGARQVVVRVAPETHDTRLVVEVRDDGKGFDCAVAHPGHMGLDSMGVRAREMGGDYAVITAPGAGTTVRITVPFAGIPDERRQPAPSPQPALSR